MSKIEQFLEALEPILNHVNEGVLISEQMTIYSTTILALGN